MGTISPGRVFKAMKATVPFLLVTGMHITQVSGTLWNHTYLAFFLLRSNTQYSHL